MAVAASSTRRPSLVEVTRLTSLAAMRRFTTTETVLWCVRVRFASSLSETPGD